MSRIENFEMEITTLDRMRTVWVYLPDNYDEKGNGFPVIYMHDGQNLFYDRLTAYGAAWHVDKVLDDIYRNTGMSCIVVGVECNDKVRFSEYSPWKATLHMRHRPTDKDNRGGEGVCRRNKGYSKRPPFSNRISTAVTIPTNSAWRRRWQAAVWADLSAVT